MFASVLEKNKFRAKCNILLTVDSLPDSGSAAVDCLVFIMDCERFFRGSLNVNMIYFKYNIYKGKNQDERVKISRSFINFSGDVRMKAFYKSHIFGAVCWDSKFGSSSHHNTTWVSNSRFINLFPHERLP